MMNRSSGILLHITSLPSPYGVGNLGKAAFDFVDFLKKAGQSYWQILPICPPGYGDSPYQAFSTFAGNPYLIDPDQLVAAGWLTQEELDGQSWGENPAHVDYALLYETRLPMLRRAFARFLRSTPADFDEYVQQESAWLPEYALFMALKAHFGNGPWTEWPNDIRAHQPAAIEHWRGQLETDIQFHCFLQYCFHKQWQRLRKYANDNGIRIIGDLPIYVPLDSADVWSHPENFQLTRSRRPRVVAGCPPDGFSRNGQFWGNPIYDWDHMAARGFDWWLERVGAAGRSFDVVRIDHFRGIESYWCIPGANRTARCGKWVQGPSSALVDAIKTAYPHIDFIAEDLGFLTPEVLKLVEHSGFPGMKVLEFAFDSRDGGDYRPHSYPKNCIAYVGTHDNEPVNGWMETAAPEDVARAVRYLNLTKKEGYHWGMMRGIWSSAADLAVVQAQDLLGLGHESRMNTPSTLGGNWCWRAEPGVFNTRLAKKLHSEMELYGRLPE